MLPNGHHLRERRPVENFKGCAIVAGFSGYVGVNCSRDGGSGCPLKGGGVDYAAASFRSPFSRPWRESDRRDWKALAGVKSGQVTGRTTCASPPPGGAMTRRFRVLYGEYACSPILRER